MSEPPYGLIWRQLARGQVIPFLGAGASLSARRPGDIWKPEQPTIPPTSAELGGHLASEATFPEPESVEDLAKVAQYFSMVGGRPILRQWLRDLFPNRRFPYGVIHRLLAEVPASLLIVTTNYDDLIEQAFEAAKPNRPYDLVIHPTDNPAWAGSVIYWKYGAQAPEFHPPNRLPINLDERTVIYKMHGAVDPQATAMRDSFVIAEDDYTDFLVRVATKKAIPAIFAEPFKTRNFLFLGYSLRDWNFRVILSKIEKDLPPERELTSWAIQYQPSLLEQALWSKRNVSIFDLTIQEFVERLRQEQAPEQ